MKPPLRLSLLILIFLAVACKPPDDPIPTLPTPQTTSIKTDEPINMLFASPAYGMHLTTWWQPDVIWRDMDLVKEMGFGWVKQPVAWSDIEKGQDGFDWYFLDEVIVPGAESRGLKLLLRLDRSPLWAVEEKPGLSANTPPQDFADYGDFCGQMAARYRGRVQAYQVWNEPNLHREWGNAKPDPVAYTQLLKVCYEAIK
ncbi:MAG TPA: hypothetical protein ENJ56_01805, partial [Anaerolineae bacterium]|nr:hypothetical protein [Anaerolineae bacterium]